jgi:hypothetical protein
MSQEVQGQVCGIAHLLHEALLDHDFDACEDKDFATLQIQRTSSDDNANAVIDNALERASVGMKAH